MPDASAIHSNYYSPSSFKKLKDSGNIIKSRDSFSLLHNNLRSLRKNLEQFETQLLDELQFELRELVGLRFLNHNSNIEK